jgi:hypothetical protein
MLNFDSEPAKEEQKKPFNEGENQKEAAEKENAQAEKDQKEAEKVLKTEESALPTKRSESVDKPVSEESKNIVPFGRAEGFNQQASKQFVHKPTPMQFNPMPPPSYMSNQRSRSQQQAEASGYPMMRMHQPMAPSGPYGQMFPGAFPGNRMGMPSAYYMHQ